MKNIRNTVGVKRNIREESMAAIRLLYNCEFGIDHIERFSLYLDLCQIIEQDKDIHSEFTTYNYYTVICYR